MYPKSADQEQRLARDRTSQLEQQVQRVIEGWERKPKGFLKDTSCGSEASLTDQKCPNTPRMARDTQWKALTIGLRPSKVRCDTTWKWHSSSL
mmetsp:Transcript_26061/g.43473  ORF Transcript_26061/g.43473 Transcript_26061/m.43473 type:complete len:93 (-) Transcript_26061:45-323(-)